MQNEKTGISQLAAAASRLIDSSPGLYLIISSILLLLVIGIPLFLYVRKKKPDSYGLFSYAFLVTCTAVYHRTPFLSLAEVNPDETQEIASAMTLLHDPVYWRSVDLGTHGPLATYPLLLPSLFGMQIDYASTRLICLAMLLVSVFLIYLMFLRTADRVMAMIAILPMIMFICMTDYWDFIAYNAEHPVALMVVLAMFLVHKSFPADGKLNLPYLYLAGFTVGSLPFAKMQSLPVAFIIAVTTLALIWLKANRTLFKAKATGIYTMGCLTFSVILLILVTSFNVYNDFLMRYVFGQISYAKVKYGIITKISILMTNFDWANFFGWNYFGFLLVADVILFFFLIRHKLTVQHKHVTPDNAVFSLSATEIAALSLSAMATAMSLYAIYVPGRPHNHYFMLLTLPLGILTGQLFISACKTFHKQESRNTYVLLFILLTAFSPFYYKYVISSYSVLLLKNRLSHEVLTINSRKFISKPTERRDKAIIAAIRKYASAGEKMAVWGWENKYYLQSGLIIACKTTTLYLTSEFGDTSYYSRSFMQELETAKAPVFLDTVAPGQYHFTNRRKHGFELIPEIKKFIFGNYICMEDVEGVRIYVSKKRINEISGNSLKTETTEGGKKWASTLEIE